MTALSQRGHEVRQLDPATPQRWDDVARWCDVLHIHRMCDTGVVKLARAAKAGGAAVVWDDDDDSARPPRGVAGQGIADGRKGSVRLAARAKLFEVVDVVTTPSRVLADVFLGDGAHAAAVIENYVIDAFVGDRMPRSGVQIGWVACFEHRFDVERLGIDRTLAALLDAHPDLRVTTLGLRLDLPAERYTHVRGVPLPEMLKLVSGFAIGIAPLSAEVPINHARSNVKVKEYAAVGVPWLASPIGPYAGLGEKQGGRAVADDRWYDELDALIRSARARRKLAKRALRWGDEQALSRNAHRWEHVLQGAVEQARRAA